MILKSDKLNMVIECDSNYTVVSNLKEVFIELEGGLYEVDVKGKQVVDLGAYYGETAIHFSKLGAKQVYAYEPFASADYIIKNCELNRCRNVKVFKQAVGGKDKYIFINKDYINNGSSRISYGIGKDPIQQVSLKSIVDKNRIRNGILKIDVEGYEFEIIESADVETLRAFSNIIIEVHSLLGDINKLMQKIADSGFDVELSSHPLYSELEGSGIKLVKATLMHGNFTERGKG